MGPRRSGSGGADRADHPHGRNADREQPGPELALDHADHGEGDVGRDDEGDHDVDGDARTLDRERVAQGPSAEYEEQADTDGDDHGVDRHPPLGGPVDVLQAQDEGELVEREADAGAEQHREELHPQTLGLPGDEGDTAAHHDDHPDDHVVDVHAALGLDVVEPPADVRADEARVRAHEEEGQQQAERERGDGGAVRTEPALTDSLGCRHQHEPSPRSGRACARPSARLPAAGATPAHHTRPQIAPCRRRSRGRRGAGRAGSSYVVVSRDGDIASCQKET